MGLIDRFSSKLPYFEIQKKAELIYEYENDYEMSNFRWMVESLYRTKKGEWFLAGEGGPMTKYRKISDGDYTYGDGLEPISPETALEWMGSIIIP